MDAPDVLDVPVDADASDVRDEVECTHDEACDDGMYCNGAERCAGGRCVPGVAPCNDGRSCTDDRCDETSRTCLRVPVHEMCSDGNACNGEEQCDPSVAGADPATGCTPPQLVELDCNDGNTCTLDGCDPTVGCVHSPRDLDGDGHVDRACTLDGTPGGPPGDDCNDGDPRVHPGAREECDDNRDNNCNAAVDYAETDVCLPTNDTCATARVLPGPGTYSASTVGLANDYTLECNPTAQADAVFEFTLTEAHNVTIAVSATGANAAVALVRDCAGPQLFCNRGSSSSAPTLRLYSLPAGTYRILAETGTPAAFNLRLALDAPTAAPPGDQCPAADTDPAVELNDGMPHVVSLATLGDDYSLSCRTSASGTSGRDAVFRLTLAAPSDVRIQATSTTGTNYVSFRASPCAAAASERRCLSGSAITGVSVLQRNLPAGTYWVLVENSSTTNPDVTVRATVTTPPAAVPPNDMCPATGTDAAVELNDGVAHVVRLAGLADDYTLSCRTSATASTAMDGVVRLTLAAPADVYLTATAPTGTTYVSVRGAACETSASELACQSGTATVPARFFRRSLPAGTYWVLVENSSSTNPDVTLTATVTSPPSGTPPEDRCPAMGAAPAVELNDGVAHVARLFVLEDDHRLGCRTSASGTSGRDAVFRLTLTAPSDVDLQATAPTGTVYLSLRVADCASTASERRCVSGSSTTGARVSQRNLPAGTYWVLVENSSTTNPDVTVRATVTTPPVPQPLGDACPAAMGDPVVELNDGVAHVARLATFGDDYLVSCRTAAASPDGVFRLTLASPSDVTLRATASTGTTYLSLRDAACTDDAAQLGCVSGFGTLTGAQYFRRSLPAGTYWVVVENTSSTNPDVTVTATLAPATAPPVGDQCPATMSDPVVELNDGMPHTAPITTFGDEHVLSCRRAGSTRDAVFRLTLAADSDVQLRGTSSSTTYLSLRTAECTDAASSELRCFSGFGTTTGASGTFRGLRAGTYYVVAETSSATSDVTVTATITTPPAAAGPGDTCPGAIVAVDGGPVTVPRSALATPHDVGTVCGSGGSSSASYYDAVFQFTLTAPGSVTVTADAMRSSTSATIYAQVFAACGVRSSAVEACASSASAPITLDLDALPAGTYFVVLESISSLVTDFRVSVETRRSP